MKLEDEIKQPKFRSHAHKAVLNIYFINCFISSRFQTILEKFDITPQQYNVLRILRGQHPKPICLGDVKSRMLDKSSDVSRMVERLRKKNLLERNNNANDRRQIDIKITKDGLKLLSSLDSKEKEMDKVLKNLSEKEIIMLNNILDKIKS